MNELNNKILEISKKKKKMESEIEKNKKKLEKLVDAINDTNHSMLQYETEYRTELLELIHKINNIDDFIIFFRNWLATVINEYIENKPIISKFIFVNRETSIFGNFLNKDIYEINNQALNENEILKDIANSECMIILEISKENFDIELLLFFRDTIINNKYNVDISIMDNEDKHFIEIRLFKVKEN